MNVNFLIGNGFDLNCGMKSSYQDIYPLYHRQASTSGHIADFKKSIVTWGDFEIEMAKYAGTLNSEIEFIDCIRDFKQFLTEYLIDEEASCSEAIFNSPRALERISIYFQNSLLHFYDGLTNNVINGFQAQLDAEPSEYNFINFNYTTLFDKFANNAFEAATSNISNIERLSGSRSVYCNRSPIHIHGALSTKDIVLGIDNSTQLGKLDYSLSRRGSRAIIKPVFNEEFDNIRVSDAIEIINRSDVICVYGMSLGISDLTWRNLLVKWLSDSPNNHLIYYDYNQMNQSGLTVDARMDEEEDAKRDFLSEMTHSQKQTDDLFSQVHIPVGHDIFDIKNAIKL